LTGMGDWPAIIDSRRFEPTCSRWPVTPSRPGPATARRRAGRRACRNSATSSLEPNGSSEATDLATD